MKKTKVLFVIPTLLRAGAERMLVNTCNELVKIPNFDIAVYTVHPGNDFQEILDPRIIVKGGDVSFHFSLYKKNKFENTNYINFVNEFQPDIIHSHLYYGDLLTHSYNYPKAIYFSHQHNSEVQEYNGINWRKFFQKRMWSDYYEFSWLKSNFKNHRTNFIACSAGTEKMLHNKIGFGKIIKLPNAVPLPILNYDHKKLNVDSLNLIWVGRLSNQKRPQLAIKIANELKNINVNFKLKIIGQGINFDHCKDLIQKLQLEEYVEMTGLIDKMENIYSEANLMIHTAVYEGLPMVFIEANSYGIPIISSDCIPNNEILTDGENGNIIQSENPLEFAVTIERIYNSQSIYEELSKDSIVIAKKFGIEKYVEKLIEVYRNEL
jgi:glycosyltransferase involved in cell wall biosynthesis